ncbi:MAG: [FeFe] hydrogenase H-cluster maturation GTPase HydF [Bacteroidales bacterium]|nr:[FeFe] hydrogenase H-cluster maturation GTPase HydF [Bacteroidales bacterium]
MKGKDLKPHIGIFGRRNNGKSSLINLLTGQNIAIVSDQPGTTTDPVKKSVEIFGVGPAIIIDTAGIDDTGSLGKLRIEKSMQVIPTIDMAVLVIAENTFGEYEEQLIREFTNYTVPFLIIHNKSDLECINEQLHNKLKIELNFNVIDFNIYNPEKKEILIDLLKKIIPETAYTKPTFFKGIIKPKDIVLLITPIDSEAPVGRMILPQVMAWRDVLDNDCICISVKETELKDFMKTGIKPSLAVTDSQVFEFVAKIVPEDVPLTSFSIMFAKYRGNFEKYLEGTPFIDKLKNDDKVLILESCTHQISCEDIGRYKIPAWLKKYTGKEIDFEVVSGLSKIPKPADEYAMVIQCGGCVVTRKQLQGRLKPFINKGIPVSNYGLTIAWINGIFERVTEPFKLT